MDKFTLHDECAKALQKSGRDDFQLYKFQRGGTNIKSDAVQPTVANPQMQKPVTRTGQRFNFAKDKWDVP